MWPVPFLEGGEATNVIFLGTGTSSGIPVIGCDCPVCTSPDPRNRRLRTSLYLQNGGTHLVVDTTPDFREQALTYRIPRVDALLFTHSHADHIFGFDDIRRYNTMQDGVIPAYGLPETIADLKRIFDYIREEHTVGHYRPRIQFREIRAPFDIGGFHVEPLAVEHGSTPTLGYVFRAEGRSLGYFPDCLAMADNVMERLQGLDVMVLDALRHRPHLTHLTVADSVRMLRRIGARQSYLVHLCHDVEHAETERDLPETIRLSYDGMTLEW